MAQSKIKEIYEEYHKNISRYRKDIGHLRRELGDLVDHIVLYGSGSAGIAFLHYLRDADIYPQFFADGDKTRWHLQCEGLDVLSPEEIVDKAGEECLVIVTINTDGKNYCKSFSEALRRGGPPAVHKRLHDAGCKNVIDYAFFRRYTELFQNEKYNLPSCSDVFLMEGKEELLEQIDECLEDELSKETFEKIVAFRLIDDSISIPTFEQKDEYFDYRVYQKVDNEVFVDCGAYTGTTLDIFLDNNDFRFQKYYAIEPDSKSYTLLEENIKKLPSEHQQKIISVEAALFDKAGVYIPFYALHSPGSFVNEIGQISVKTDTIDHLLDGGEASFIKMNIEGSEMPALRGATDTIKKYAPAMAISGYHKTMDLWEVPLLIKDLNPKYHLYLRSYMNHMSFMYYAVPDERRV